MKLNAQKVTVLQQTDLRLQVFLLAPSTKYKQKRKKRQCETIENRRLVFKKILSAKQRDY